MISITALRDITLSLGALSVAGFAVDEMSGGRLGRALRQPTAVPPARHGWLYALDAYSTATEVRVRPRRPATAQEAAASAASAAAGDGGWIGLGRDGTIHPIDDPTPTGTSERLLSSLVDVVYVTDARPDSRLHTLAQRTRAVLTLAWQYRADRARMQATLARIQDAQDALADDTALDESEADVRLTADVVALTRRDDGVWHVLLIRRRWEPYAGQLALPGGHVDPGESTAAAAARELEEETGVHVDAIVLEEIGTYAGPGRDPRGHYISTAYLAVLDTMPAPTAADDATAATWVPVARALGENTAFDHENMIIDALRLTGDPHADPYAPSEVTPLTGVDDLLDEADTVLVQGELDDPATGTDTRLR